MSFLPTMIVTLCVGILVGSYPQALAQKIESIPAYGDRIVRVQTALNHLTVIELSEPITMVAAGSPAFKIERRENRVFIQPLEEGESTNLFVWTAGHRYSYELAPAGSITAMHFALDHQAPVASAAEVSEKGKTDTEHAKAVVDALLDSIPVRWQGSRTDDRRVTVAFRDILKLSDRWVIRYGVSNRTDQSYPLRAPRILLMAEPTSRLSLIPLSCVQLGPEEAGHVRSNRKEVVEPIQADAEARLVTPGQEVPGVISIAPPSNGSKPVVLQFEFPDDQRGRVTGTLVL